MARVRIALVSALMLAACAGSSQDLDPSVPSATLEFTKGYTTGANASEATIQEYALSPNGQCATREEAASFTWINGGVTRRRAEAGQRLHVSAVTTYYASAMRVVGQCSAWASFTPQAGRTYRVTQVEQRMGVCELRVVDQDLGQAPSDLEINTTGCPLPTRIPR